MTFKPFRDLIGLGEGGRIQQPKAVRIWERDDFSVALWNCGVLPQKQTGISMCLLHSGHAIYNIDMHVLPNAS